ncbi:DUF4232 domain-containing protein [Streptomyces sp. NPDC047130]|uniref:DUF4232 domain-containing protein n=1 Tax=Streptomyces sp. NPDC047130 TaxID=3155261 RepID=UPI0033CE0845
MSSSSRTRPTTPARRPRRPRRRNHLLGAAVAAALLACAACQAERSDEAATTEPSVSPSAGGSAKPTGTAEAGPGEDDADATGGAGGRSPGEGGDGGTGRDGGDDGPGGSGGGGGGGGGGGKGGPPACDALDLEFSATLESPEGEDPDHLLIAVTNTGDTRCEIYHHPHLWLGEPSDRALARQPVAPLPGSNLDELVTLDPGAEAFSGLFAGDIPMDQYETDAVTLQLHGLSPDTQGSQPVLVALPQAVPFDDGARVTYWTSDVRTALDLVRSA